MTSKLRSIQKLRAVAILLVLVLHTYSYERTANIGVGLLPNFSVFCSSGVDLFFVISGFVMVYTTRSTGTGWPIVFNFLQRRFLRIYPLYWLYTGILLVLYSTIPETTRRVDLAQVSVLKSVLLFPQATDPILVVGWTLIHEVYFYIVFSLLLLFRRRILPYLLGLWALALVVVNFISEISNFGPVAKLIFNPLTVEFIAGCYVAFFMERLNRISANKAMWVGVAWLLIGWTFHYHYFEAQGLTLAQRVVVLGLPYTLIVWGAVRRETNIISSWSRLFELIGDASYSIYLTHCLVLSGLARLFSRMAFGPESILDNLLFINSGVLLCIAVGIASYRLIEFKLLGAIRFNTVKTSC